VIEVSQLVKFHGPLEVLRGVDLTVATGEFAVLVGPSGGGKSTLLRCINGLETFDTGTVTAFGHTLTGTRGKPRPTAALLGLRRAVGMVFQQFHLFPHLTALENVTAGPVHALGVPRGEAEAAAVKLLDRVGRGDKRGSFPAQLSGGQQQRVAIARALAVNPRAILFDEPTSALDPAMAREVVAVIRDLAAAGQTMVVVTHDMDLARAATVAHRMEAGRVAVSGRPDDVLQP
jgi:ABC-type polar amino acid transport system ATPase subunit